MDTAATSDSDVLPSLTRGALLAFQFSSWYPTYAPWTIKSTIIRPLGDIFSTYLESDGVFLPEGSEDQPLESTLSDDEDDQQEEAEEQHIAFAFAELDQKIREIIAEYGAVFPKLNFSSPRDAAWILPASSPLKCVSPADVYLLLKSSDFILHDVDAATLFEACEQSSDVELLKYELELVLRKWYPVDQSRELRCFVRGERLFAVSQRDPNYYEFWNEQGTQSKVLEAVTIFWKEHIKGKWPVSGGNYTFDFLLTRDLTRGHIIDFNPYCRHTDPLLYTYDELHEIHSSLLSSQDEVVPDLRVVDSRSHPAATRNAPAHQHNMVPIDALTLSQGRNIEEFAGVWQEELRSSTVGNDSDNENDSE